MLHSSFFSLFRYVIACAPRSYQFIITSSFVFDFSGSWEKAFFPADVTIKLSCANLAIHSCFMIYLS